MRWILLLVCLIFLVGCDAFYHEKSLVPKHDIHLVEVDGHKYVIAYPVNSYRGVALVHHAGCNHISHRGDIYRKLCK